MNIRTKKPKPRLCWAPHIGAWLIAECPNEHLGTVMALVREINRKNRRGWLV